MLNTHPVIGVNCAQELDMMQPPTQAIATSDPVADTNEARLYLVDVDPAPTR